MLERPSAKAGPNSTPWSTLTFCTGNGHCSRAWRRAWSMAGGRTAATTRAAANREASSTSVAIARSWPASRIRITSIWTLSPGLVARTAGLRTGVTVDFEDNYSGEYQVPTVLPARFPNLLVNGSQGIAVAMATNIPPHNLREVIDATIHLIDHPDATPDDLMQFVKGPDFPTGGLILGRQGIMDAYRTGRGSIKMRAKAEIVETRRGGTAIIVTELPYQVSPRSVLTRIKELVDARELDGIRDAKAFGRYCADRIAEAIEFEGPDTVAAVFLEPVQNAGGCFPPPPGYFERVREICDEYDVLLVSDEVICAYGRIGSMFACNDFGYVPDIIT